MKATELMIGDWVLYNKTPKRIGGIDGKIIRFFRWDVWENPSAIEPIPLTAEILEKNKFSIFGESHYVLFNKDMTIKFSLYFPSKDNYWLIIGHRQYPIRSVHELQHALRLCGIEKEIEL